jgi:hypothetical protein
MAVAGEPGCFFAYDEQEFAVGFEADEPVDDVDAGFFELACP